MEQTYNDSSYLEYIKHNIMLIKKRNENIIIFPLERRQNDKEKDKTQRK